MLEIATRHSRPLAFYVRAYAQNHQPRIANRGTAVSKAMAEATKLSDRMRRAWSRLRDWRIGITGRLGISFAVVGALAAIANVLVEQGVSIIEITRFSSIETRVVERQRDPVPAPVSVASSAPVPTAFADTTSSSVEAVDRYEAAVAVRAQNASSENDARVAAAQRELLAERAGIANKSGAKGRGLEQALDTFRDSGTRYIGRIDQRRATMDAYAAGLASLTTRLEQSVNRSWIIFGRVVAREGVLRLRGRHEQLRSDFAALRVSDTLDGSAVEAIVATETEFRRTLVESERGLIRAEGREWFDGIQSDFDRLVSLRAALVDEWESQDATKADFLKALSRAREAVRVETKVASSARARPSPVVIATPIAAPFVGPPILAPFVGPPLLPPILASAIPEAETRVSRQETDRAKQQLVAWLTGGFLVVVLLISVATVRSIVVPIRRLLNATSQLGKHGTHTPVPRGGIRELDTLTQSFNRMAEEIVCARQSAGEHQQQLEERVKERTRQLQELAECDPLTGLPNRRHLLALLETALSAAHRDAHLVAVFFLDLDNFKNINDSMGHGFGDEVLRAVAERLADIARSIGFAARLGGDEFTVVLTGQKNIEEIRNTGLQVIAAFQNPLSIGNRDLMISVSVGASIYPNHESTAEGLLKAADAALFRAKALGRSQLSVYTPELLAEAAKRFTTEQGLRRAVERGDFELMFQPEVSSDTLETVLVEALVRWRMPDGRLASPVEFLAVAEESGLIAEISDWVLRAAVEAAALWFHGEWPKARVAINVSARQLLDHRFVEKLRALLDEFELPTRCIEIELTETVMQTGSTTIDSLNRLHAAGIAIALDDFGTGYSSLASIEKLPFSRIKLDRSLVDGIATSPRAAGIARAIIRLCHDLNLAVTAEGVETRDQLEALTRHGPICLQGYLLSKPVVAQELLATLDRLADDVPILMAGRVSACDPLDTGADPTLAARDIRTAKRH